MDSLTALTCNVEELKELGTLSWFLFVQVLLLLSLAFPLLMTLARIDA